MTVSIGNRRVAKITVAAMAVLGVGALASGCTAAQPGDDRTTQVLQTVGVRLAPDGKIQTIDGTAVMMNQSTGSSRSEATSYQPRQVVNDLPVRVTTRYHTKDGTGSDLSEISGYTGRVEVDVTLENLTVVPENLTYDAVGASRTTPALVGTPLSVAATATLENTAPSTVVFDAGADHPTNGVVSARKDGGSIVQWGTVLAPPRSEATTTLRLVADVKDFAVPAFDIAVQAGLHADLSFTGVLASALDTGKSSEMTVQRQAIDLIAQVNDVLARAGATVTQVRKNLEDTSGTLGVRAGQRLQDSSRQLTAEMKSLSGQIGALQQSLSSSVTGGASSVNSELAQIVAAMNGMLGDTTGAAPVVVDGAGCTATTRPSAPDGTVYSTFRYLSALLDGYATVSDTCRTQILSELDSVIGPASPDATVCLADTSATCALFNGRTSVQTSLANLVTRGRQIVSGINTAAAADGLTAQARVTATLDLIRQAVATLDADSKDKTLWNTLLGHVHDAQAASATLRTLRDKMVTLRASLDGEAGSVKRQQIDVADQVCDLKGSNPTVAQAALDAISAQLTGRTCAGTPAPAALLPPNGSLEQRLQAQIDLWDQAITALDASTGTSPISAVNAALAALESAVTQALSAIDDNSSSGQRSAAALASLLATATAANDVVRASLTQIQTDQATLGQQIMQGFTDASQTVNQEVGTDIGSRIASLNAQNQQTQQRLSTSYQSLIDSLRSSATKTVADGKTFTDRQKSNLASQQAAATAALDKSTTAAMQIIQASTSAATQDMDAASQQLTSSLENVLLDLGSPNANASGILGSMAASAAKSATADYQLAEASQNAAGFANVRDEDISGLLLQQAQFRTALKKAAALAPFHLDIPAGATSQTVYTFRIDGAAK